MFLLNDGGEVMFAPYDGESVPVGQHQSVICYSHLVTHHAFSTITRCHFLSDFVVMFRVIAIPTRYIL